MFRDVRPDMRSRTITLGSLRTITFESERSFGDNVELHFV